MRLRFLVQAGLEKILNFSSGANLGGGCRGCAPLPEMTAQLSNTTGILQKRKKLCAPLLRKIVDLSLQLGPQTLEQLWKFACSG